jgi:hypothetical protein
MGITLRNVTGSALTYNQMDENFRFLSQSYFYLSGSNTGNASFSGSLIVSGTTIFSGSTTVDTSVGNFIVTDDIGGDSIFIVSSTAMGMVGTSSFTGPVTTIGNTRTTGSVNISGSTTITGSLRVSGSITGSLLGIASTASSVTSLNQNVVITGSLTVSGSSTFTNIGPAVFTGSMTTTGSNTLIGSTILSGSVSISGSQTLNGTSTSVGTQIVTGSLLTSGSQTLIGNTVLSGSINVSGSTTFVGTHTLSGSNTITGNTVLSGSIIVSGSANFRNTTFTVTGSQFYTGSSVYVGNQTITGSLSLTSNGTGTGLFINGQKQFNYLSAYHTASITPTQNVSGSFIYSTLVTSSGITINNSQITFANTGIYNIQFSAQIFTATGANVYIWFKRNGTNITNSATRIGPTSNNEYVVAAWNFVDIFTSGSYVEIAYQSDQTNTQFQYVAATGNIPAIPAIIATVTQIA